MSKQERITLYKTKTDRIEGRPITKEEEFYKCWSEILDLIGTESYEAYNSKLENVVVFRVRWCKKLEELRNRKDFFIKWKDIKYEIYTVDFMGNSKDKIKLKCKMVI